MGTSEPPEQWAPAESLDPTPVWKQYALVAILALGFLALSGVYAYLAVLPDVVTPPAALPGRVVLSTGDHPPGTTKLVDIAGADRSFYLVRFGAEDAVALRTVWSPQVGGAQCRVALASQGPVRFGDTCTRSSFDERGMVVAGDAPRSLDRYLVSRKGDRLVVNLDHVIQGVRR